MEQDSANAVMVAVATQRRGYILNPTHGKVLLVLCRNRALHFYRPTSRIIPASISSKPDAIRPFFFPSLDVAYQHLSCSTHNIF